MSEVWAPPGGSARTRQPPMPPAPSEPVRSAGPVGTIPLRPMSTGEVLDSTFATIRRNPRATLGVAALFATVQELALTGLQALTGSLSAPVVSIGQGSSTDAGLTLTSVLAYPISATFAAVLTGLMSLVIMADIQGQRTSMAQLWRAARPRLWALLLCSLLAGAAPYLGLVLLVAPGVMLWGFWALATPVLMLEGWGPWKSLGRSWRLVRGDYWRVLGIRALAVLIGFLMRFILVLPFVVAAAVIGQLANQDLDQPGLLFFGFGVAGAIVANTVVGPFQAGVQAFLYVDRRMRGEALDILWQRQNGRPA